MTKDYMNFFVANRESDVPVYIEPSDKSTTMTNIFSNNIGTVKEEAFSYDKTTIINAFWSGKLPTNLSDADLAFLNSYFG